jgi:hypothetical protein
LLIIRVQHLDVNRLGRQAGTTVRTRRLMVRDGRQGALLTMRELAARAFQV